MPHITCCLGSNAPDTRLGDYQRSRTSMREPKRLCVRRPPTRTGRVVLIPTPLLATAVPQSCWTSLCPNRRTHIVFPIRVWPIANNVRQHMALSLYGRQIIVAAGSLDHSYINTQIAVSPFAAAKLGD